MSHSKVVKLDSLWKSLLRLHLFSFFVEITLINTNFYFRALNANFKSREKFFCFIFIIHKLSFRKAKKWKQKLPNLKSSSDRFNAKMMTKISAETRENRSIPLWASNVGSKVYASKWFLKFLSFWFKILQSPSWFVCKLHLHKHKRL